MPEDYTFCKTCNRVVWATDVDDEGNCIDHSKPGKFKAAKEEKPTTSEETPKTK